MPLFQKTIINKYLKTQNTKELQQKWEVFHQHFHNPVIQENIRNSKEEQYQGEFLIDLFVNVLGYIKNPVPDFNLTTEYKNVKDSKKADGAIVINSKVAGIIELKGTNTTDLSKIEDQAFGYKNNQKDCKYVITSNFEKLRFYIDNAIEHLEFNLFELTQEDFELLYLCLAFQNISADIPAKIKEESLSQEDVITKKLYKDYSLFKRELFQNLLVLNPEIDQLELFKKSQKLLDRFLFLFFGEDSGLLPPNSVRMILEQWDKLRDLDEYVPLYDRFRKYFTYLNTGFKGKQFDVFAYNGGLFKPDEILDTIKINDQILYTHTLKLAEYDFESEVDVNILGHIFENSLNEIDEIKAQLAGEVIDKSKTKRKKDGVFYTPKYITKYIVENTVGKLCTEKKAEIKIVDEEYFTDKKRQTKTKEALLLKLKTYRDWLLQITIIDPACGSGAFLNEALNFLMAEHQYLDELETKLLGGGFVFPNIENSILENNLFGVDLNEESVEIAKLSLWLRTAQPYRKLNDLNNNIKCGNSLIDNPAIAGDKAFNWEQEFPQVFVKGGFDVVIGNPPYGAYLNDFEKLYLESTFSVFEYQVNTYVLFYEQGIKILKQNGLLGFITPATFLSQFYFRKLRNFLQQFCLLSIAKYSYEVFNDADIGDAVSWIMKKSSENIKVEISNFKNLHEAVEAKIDLFEINDIINEDKTYNINSGLLNFSKFKNAEFVDLSQIANIIVGIKPYQKGKGKPMQSESDVINKNFTAIYQVDESYIPCIIGKDFHRYKFLSEPEMYLSYGVWLAEPRQSAPFFEEKIIIRQTADSLICNLDLNKRINLNNVYNVGLLNKDFDLRYLLSLLNSKILNLYYQNISQEKGRLFAEVKKTYLSQLPIKKTPLESQQPFIAKADQMLSLNKELQEVNGKFQRNVKREFSLEKLSKKLEGWYKLPFSDYLTELKKLKVELTLSQKAELEDYFIKEQQIATALQSEITKTDAEIDQMVYELYGLTEEEIRIVEKD
ncbi:N-6 DNA methylase [Chryseobacterium wangxinyae]|uniref:Eco57I restriction-modification methylase domain-containing protein n=1 Tax=Chryseobacterium sp. CY350 TaxID=2997336 RepID=UPI00226FB8E2|nr:TaqI-like C-terminal specificity domain-containing protein [Chryseobacterium sp. CY350]MCY0976274.1 N-6 DNA methylase [Chryseobacterium sp. CY350]WBZ94128.1 N-6 DNA methylase [Chryseobacterium sp. CY350]